MTKDTAMQWTNQKSKKLDGEGKGRQQEMFVIIVFQYFSCPFFIARPFFKWLWNHLDRSFKPVFFST